MAQLEKDCEDYKRNIREHFSGQREELEAEIESFPTKIRAEEEKGNNVETSLKKTENKLKTLNNNYNDKTKRLGQLENEETRQKERKKTQLSEARKLQTDFSLPQGLPELFILNDQESSEYYIFIRFRIFRIQ